jgi:hypothetical protein
MSLMDLLAAAPSGMERLQKIMPLVGGGAQPGALGGGFGPPAPSGTVGDVEATARDFFLSHGYSKPEWRKVDSIIEQESHWDPHAQNPDSPAAGLAQNINGFSQGYSENDPMEQIRWLYNYLNGHNYEGYGTGIDAAYAHKQATGWY